MKSGEELNFSGVNKIITLIRGLWSVEAEALI